MESSCGFGDASSPHIVACSMEQEKNICLTLGEVVLALITCRFSCWDLKIDRSLSDSRYFQETTLTNDHPHRVFS